MGGGGGQMFEESKHEEDVSGKQGPYIEGEYMQDDLGNRDLFSTACTTPNLSSIDEAQSFITAALSLLPSS